jgi:hypothetical protein
MSRKDFNFYAAVKARHATNLRKGMK